MRERGKERERVNMYDRGRGRGERMCDVFHGTE